MGREGGVHMLWASTCSTEGRPPKRASPAPGPQPPPAQPPMRTHRWLRPGLQVANTAQRVCSATIMPALATCVVCCSIASWMAALRVECAGRSEASACHLRHAAPNAAPQDGHSRSTVAPASPCFARRPAPGLPALRKSETHPRQPHLSFSGMPSNSSMQHTPPSASTSAPASRLHPAPSCTAAAVRPTCRRAAAAMGTWQWAEWDHASPGAQSYGRACMPVFW